MSKLGIQFVGDIIAPYFLPALNFALVWIVLLACNVIFVVDLASNQMSTLVASVCNADHIYILYTIITLKVSLKAIAFNYNNYYNKITLVTRKFTTKIFGLKFSVNNRCYQNNSSLLTLT